ncbi:DDE-type integrase/transposase/recombinase [Blastococcus sp. TF02A-30]|uniref:DDE-type integrase/transposase/recombinase n=1 Tax=Blastococcus sp. TF02A-30 TaxID=2250580 RepID=UPI0011BFB145|nr:DDE-type integrase/transposase/recombinase [Blastococcus sp. TF02A-30]
MPSTATAASPELEESVLSTLLRLKEQWGFVSNRDVQRAAIALNCSTRRIRRMIERGYVRAPRAPWRPDADLTVHLVRHKGSVAQMHKALCRKGQDPGVSVRTMQRYFAAEFDQRLLCGARGGYQALRDSLPTTERRALARNEEWSIDHTLLPIWVVMPDGGVRKPWMTTVLDSATRMVMAFTIGPRTPSTEESAETLAAAMEGYTTAEGVFVGGRPESLHSDRGGDLVTHALTLGLIREGVNRSFTEAYSPHQNGKIERWHRTIKNEYLPALPGFDRSTYVPNDPRKDAQPLSPEGLLSLAGLQAEVVRSFREYNFDRSHSGINGKTPFEEWASQSNPIERADAQAIRASMLQEESRVVTRGRVQWERRFYSLTADERVPAGVDTDTGEVLFGDSWKSVVEGKRVLVRHLPSRLEFVEVYTTNGEYVGRAHWTQMLDAEEAAKASNERRQAFRTMRTSLEEIARADAEAAAKHNASPQMSEDDRDFGPTPSSQKTRKEQKRSQPSGAMKRAASARAQKRNDLQVISTGALSRTGTDDLDF